MEEIENRQKEKEEKKKKNRKGTGETIRPRRRSSPQPRKPARTGTLLFFPLSLTPGPQLSGQVIFFLLQLKSRR
jgi:hypothetical protein